MLKPPRPMPRPVLISFSALIVGALLWAFYMYVVDGLVQVRLQSLPPLFFVLLFSVPVLQLVAALVWDTTPLDRVGGTSSSYVRWLVGGCMALLLAFLNNLVTPHWGGTTVVFLAVGCTYLVAAYSIYRRSRVLK